MQRNFRCVIHRRGLVSSPERVGEPNPYGFNGAVASWFFNPCNPLIHVIRDSDDGTCRPSGALVIWCMPPVYKHAAPLGLKAAQFSLRHPSQGLGFLARWVGEPNRYGLLRFPVSRLPYDAATCRPSGALVIWCMSRFYKHVAPLGLNAAQFSVRHPSQGLGFLAQRVG